MNIFEFVVLSFLISGMFLTIVLIFKNDNTCMQQMRIACAIGEYGHACIRSGEKRMVEFEDMESYDRTLFRLWDWGYTRILPPDKFEIIRAYVK